MFIVLQFVLLTIVVCTCEIVRMPLSKSLASPQHSDHRIQSSFRRKFAKVAWHRSVGSATSSHPSTLIESKVTGESLGYYTSIFVGQPPVEFVVNIDTGSTRLWIPSRQCQACAFRAGSTTTYSSSTSKSFQPETDPQASATISYGSGSVSGIAGRETISWSSLQITNVPILVVSNETASMKRALGALADGIMGLGFDGGLTSGYHESMVHYFLQQQQYAMFSLWLNHSSLSANDPSVQDGNGGNLLLGGVDTQLYNGNFTFLPVVPLVTNDPSGGNGILRDSTYWCVKPGPVSVGSTVIPLQSMTNVFFDSGESFIQLDPSTANAIANALGGMTLVGGVYQFSCSLSSRYPPVVFSMANGASFALPPEYYVIRSSVGSDTCTFAIRGRTRPNNQIIWILGDPFLRKYYTLYDLQNEQVGVAVAADGMVPGTGVPLTDAALLANGGPPKKSKARRLASAYFGTGLVVVVVVAVGGW